MRRRSTRKGRSPDFYRICDRTGFKVYASETRKEWDDQIVWDRVFEERQPQDFVRGVRDDPSVPDPRPQGVATFIGPLVTEINDDQSPGDTSLTLLDNTRMTVGDRIAIAMDSSDVHFTTIASLDQDGVTVTVNDALPAATSAGKTVTDYSAVASATLD